MEEDMERVDNMSTYAEGWYRMTMLIGGKARFLSRTVWERAAMVRQLAEAA